MKKIVVLLSFLALLQSVSHRVEAQKNVGQFSNLVVFVRFPEQANQPFTRTLSAYDKLFNDSTGAEVNSVYNYFKGASYRQLYWKSSFFPADGEMIKGYTAQNVRGYYLPNSDINPDGYNSEVEAKSREQGLIKEIATYLGEQLPADVPIDMNADGRIDNLCIILAGTSDRNADRLLWPHRGAFLLANPPTIQGKRIAEYLMVFDDGNGLDGLKWKPLTTGLLCHEMAHTLGTHDLYHAQKGLNPVGVWGLMSDNTPIPQQMLMYTKQRYCQWVEEIPEITEPNTYTLNPVNGASKERTAYKIKPMGSDEYFVVEYRRKSAPFDATIPESGLLVYRINPVFSGGNVGYNGTTRLDETYIFRPGGTPTADGDLSKAVFSAESGRTAFGGTASQKPFYSDGREAKFALSEVSTCGETISFRLLPFARQIYLPLSSVSLLGNAGSSAQVTVQSDVHWQINTLPDWLDIQPRGGAAGTTTLQIQSRSANRQPATREATIQLIGNPETNLTASLYIAQQSNLVHPPTALAASRNGNDVELTWQASVEGEALFNEGFEKGELPAGWLVKGAEYRNWEMLPAERWYPAFHGNYSATVKAAFEEKKQDARLITPAFNGGKTVSFFSRSNAVGRTSAGSIYQVEVSKDDGATWQSVFDLKTEGKAVNQYEPINISLAAFASEKIRVAFHAYDTTEKGLDYHWQVDNVAVYPEVTTSIITGYNIYRNGVKIGTSTVPSFTDKQPLADDNVYAVKAFGNWGETLPSNSVAAPPASTGLINSPAETLPIQWRVANNHLLIQSETALRSIRVYTLQGSLVEQQPLAGNAVSCSIAALPQGIYIALITLDGQQQPVRVKFMKK